MAKLSARGRTEYVRARRGAGPNREEVVAYMSDGAVLGKVRKGGWKVRGRWDRVRVTLPELRGRLIAEGWTILRGDGPRARAVAS